MVWMIFGSKLLSQCQLSTLSQVPTPQTSSGGVVHSYETKYFTTNTIIISVWLVKLEVSPSWRLQCRARSCWVQCTCH